MSLEQAVVTLRDQLKKLEGGSDSLDRIGQQIVKAKTEVIEKYSRVFAPEHISALTEAEFKSFLLFKNNHHWDSLHRQGTQMTADMATLRRALAILVDEGEPLRQRLDRIRPPKGEPMVKGLGRAVISAILQIRSPDKYGIVNSTAEDAMKTLGVWLSFPNKASFSERYESINAVLLEIASQIPTDLWTLDMLWWRVVPHVPIGSGVTTPTSLTDQAEDLTADGVSGAAISSNGGAFALESHLQEFLVENWAQTDFGSDWSLLEKDGEIVGSYYNTHEVGQIDLLARHKNEKRWLVIELKRDQTSDATVGQLLRYRSWVRQNLAGAADVVEGVIVCSDADLKLKYAIKGLENVRCMTYKVRFVLAPAELSTAQSPDIGSS